MLRIAIISDLHAYEAEVGPAAPSYFCIRDTSRSPGSNPIAALEELMKSENLRADIVLCPGDVTDKAHPGALAHGWRVLNDFKAPLQASFLAATTGNHDVDSRLTYSSYSLTDALKNLAPAYPLPDCDQAENNAYWGRGFAVVDHQMVRILVINSSGQHGTADECKRGRLGARELDEIDRTLTGTSRTINIALCHHHPHQHMEIGLGEDDVMRGGQLFLDMLGSGRHGRWVVIHGHKHHPKITYSSGGAASPVVFASGSVSAQLYPSLATVARNQFYIMTLESNPLPDVTLGGTVACWDWAAGAGWRKAGDTSGLPHEFGFGCRHDPRAVAERVAGHLSSPVMKWHDVLRVVPELRYMLPQDVALVIAHLATDFSVNADPATGTPTSIGRAP
jgi:predicted phosphodiesterase